MIEKKYCAHRGFNAVAPENTLPAFAEAVALGADEIEFDIWPTKDGRLIVCHDPKIDRTTNGVGNICDMILDEIRCFDAGIKFSEEYSGVRLPLFEEVLQQFAGKVVMNIHIKSLGKTMIKDSGMDDRAHRLAKIYIENTPLSMPLPEQEEEVIPIFEEIPCEPYDDKIFAEILRVIDQYQCRDTVYITGEKDVLQTAFRMAPDIKRCCLEGHMNYSIVENAIKYKCSRVQFCKLFLTREMIERAHASGMLCNLFWSDDLEEANAFFDMGIDVILTNHYLKIARR